ARGRPASPPAAHRRARPVEPGGGLVRHVRALRGPRTGLHRGRRPPGGGEMSTTPVTAVRPTPRNAVPRTAPRTQITLQRERHEPEYGILVAIVALAAIGILMVY